MARSPPDPPPQHWLGQKTFGGARPPKWRWGGLCNVVCPHLGYPLPWGGGVCVLFPGGILSPRGVSVPWGGPFPQGGAVPALQPSCAPSAAARVTRRRRAATLSRCCASGEAAAPEPPRKEMGTPPRGGIP